MASLKKLIFFGFLSVFCFIRPLKSEQDNVFGDCDNIDAFPFYKNTARGLDVTTGKRVAFSVFDLRLKNGLTCKAYKNGKTWQKIPSFFYSVSPQSFTETTWREIYSELQTNDMNKKIRDLRFELGHNNRVEEPGLLPVPSSFEIELGLNRNIHETRVTRSSELSYISRHIIRHHSYDIAFDRVAEIRLDQRFITDIQTLPVTFSDRHDDNYRKYLMLYDTYGHLVPQSLELGGIYYYLLVIDKCTLHESTITTDKTSTNIGAKVDVGEDIETAVDNGIKHIAHGGLSTEDADTIIKNITRRFSFTSEDNTVRGGTLQTQVELSKGNLIYLSDWIHTLRENPTIIDGNYIFLYDLLDNPAFDNLTNHGTIKANLRLVMGDIMNANMSDTDRCYLKCQIGPSRKCVCSCSEKADPGEGCCKPDGAHAMTLSSLLCFITSSLHYFMK